MSVASVIFLIIWLFQCEIASSQYSYKQSHSSFIERLILKPSKKDVTLKIGANFSMICASTHPITWKPFLDFKGIYQVNHVEILGNERRYESTIYLMDINHYYVGAYSCSFNDSSYEQPVYRLNNQVYIYVNDIEHLFVWNDPYRLFYTQAYHDFDDDDNASFSGDDQDYIPCKPTSKNITVTLIREGDEITISLENGRGWVLQPDLILKRQDLVSDYESCCH